MGVASTTDVFGRLFSGALALGVGAVSVVIVCQSGMSRAGTDQTAGVIMAALAVVAVMYSMGSLVYSRRFLIENRIGLRWLFIVGLIVSESYIVFNEAAWFKQHVMVSEERSHIERIKAKGDVDLIEDAQSTLEALRGKKLSDEREVYAAIDRALAQEIDLGHGSSMSLTKATKACTNQDSASYSRCGDVLSLREELASVQAMKGKAEQAKIAIGTSTVGTRDVPLPANAGAILVADIAGISESRASNFYLGLGLVLLACFRVTVFPILVSPAKADETPRNVLAQVTLTPTGANDAENYGSKPQFETDSPKLPPPSGPKPGKRTLEKPSAAAAVLSDLSRAMAPQKAFGRPGTAVGSVEVFYAKQTIAIHGAEHSAGKHTAQVFWRSYLAWCKDEGFTPVKVNEFRKESERFVKKDKAKRGPNKNRCEYGGRTLLRLVA